MRDGRPDEYPRLNNNLIALPGTDSRVHTNPHMGDTAHMAPIPLQTSFTPSPHPSVLLQMEATRAMFGAPF